MKIVLLVTALAFLAPACRDAPSKEQCIAVAKKRSRVIFAGRTGKNADRTRKMEFEASLEECMADWTKEQADCVVKARNRNQVIACH
ncbi:MAG: hypothetical protein JKY56_21845 [Kofleriaceae bacterium]|nr:hypothetical protein [Kofleriaceae bacterium]